MLVGCNNTKCSWRFTCKRFNAWFFKESKKIFTGGGDKNSGCQKYIPRDSD